MNCDIDKKKGRNNVKYYDETKPFSRQLKTALYEADLSQAELSRKLEISLKNIEAWVAGTRVPPAWTAELLLEKLNKLKN